MKLFFSCDWGTSTFRLRLVDPVNQTVLSEVKTDYGIASAFAAWKELGAEEKDRMAFYQKYLSHQVKKIATSLHHSFDGAPVVLSGMASSSIGMMELPYKELPFQCNGRDLAVHAIPEGKENQYKIFIISGVKSDTDVIRGEETMLAGCAIGENQPEHLFIFPGTHSKHIFVRNGIAKHFLTYMTGELFDLLTNKSILSTSVKKNSSDSINDHHFINGVIKGASANVMNCIFHVRTNQLFNKMTAEDNYHYLSGLLIGHELKDIAANKPTSITLVCSEGLKKPYDQALSTLALDNMVHYVNADKALISGQWKIMQQNGYLD